VIEMAKKKLPAVQFSPDGSLALVPAWSQFNDKDVWWTLKVKSPKTGGWVITQGGTTAYWMIDLGFNPYATE
jgi:hypothetical protein